MLENRRSFGIHTLTEKQIKTAVKNGLNEGALHVRLCVPPYWTVEKAINTPIKKVKRLEVTWTDEDIKEAEKNGIEHELFKRRIRIGFTVEDAKNQPYRTKKRGQNKSG